MKKDILEGPKHLAQGKVISKKESILEIVSSALFSLLLVVFCLKPGLLAIYQKGVAPIPMLSDPATKLMLILLVLALAGLAVSLAKLLKKRWTLPLLWTSCIIDLAGALYFFYFITRWNALNPSFIRFFRNDLATWKTIAKAAGTCYLLLTIISVADDLYRVYRQREK
ncbi:hypothetical protein [Sphaerochaeta sp. PS]|uniref:hypothetical protein n=1 Tax=Sphaerochaeta sp. PS TaxID=3076336 RepID=UPI0028A5658A|nr:hypothetical protein [Sphaerochaeta sp. PS]MDT4762696.1 hypothetical protein [Sphaerochaeta sp. PS]